MSRQCVWNGQRLYPPGPLREALLERWPCLGDGSPLRKEMSTYTLAEMVGVDRTEITRILKLQRRPSEGVIDRICCLGLGVHPASIYGDLWFETG